MRKAAIVPDIARVIRARLRVCYQASSWVTTDRRGWDFALFWFSKMIDVQLLVELGPQHFQVSEGDASARGT
ncbi:hypothetical protein OKW40_006618 [Paraburkholderia sp. RAU6.4a]|uniref:hypothetical protein n=1 Tax=Paraburkholderia sp. RAU6.4a TaxID=2991067 RepID=UPI003D1D7973